MTYDNIITVDEAAVSLGVSSRTVWSLIREGALSPDAAVTEKFKRTMIRKAEVARYKRERAK